ncbi:LLM class flavin-dependent oxidoreductase [Nocardia sp. CDC159]|uniref:LLM class flavin-dependent oxidoreductase n=1 Tax=Nocardia pulmonis TaxID=2951408 RepID=A0A9X2EFS5_9NOCA|nr:MULTISPECIES: LLM class flavin-dependent oxidoreductase [Nocardia]MCM6778695.1 LLM class flavin-dependent oxidoreductase [Nocardia pulmonis]MCM6791584.1 LLM class flavin-dependent oxidoreductase [Nocardia sp. CDC159]
MSGKVSETRSAPVDVGLVFDLRNPQRWHRPWADRYARALEFCEEADRRGAGGVWFTEHHLFDDGYLPQPLTFAAAAAARTHNVRIGTAVVLPALRKPAQLAEEAAVVDLISGGRLELGLGAGYRVPEYQLFDTDFGQRFRRTGAAIEEVRRLWETGGVTPGPVQDPVPLWGGFYGPRGARLAGRLGMGLMHISHEMFTHYRAGLIEGGHDPEQARVADLVPVVLADDPEQAWDRIVPHMVYQKNSYRRLSVEGTDRPLPPELGPEDIRRRPDDGSWGILEVLTPQQAADRIAERIAGLPVRHLILWADIAGMPDDLVARNIELASEQLPSLLAARLEATGAARV